MARPKGSKNRNKVEEKPIKKEVKKIKIYKAVIETDSRNDFVAIVSEAYTEGCIVDVDTYEKAIDV